MKNWLKVLVAVPALCLGALPLLGQQQDASQQQSGDPVADAARKAREEKKAEAKPKKVYTDDDVVHSHPDTANQPPPSGEQATPNTEAAKAGPAGAPGDEKKDEKKDDEAAWRKRFKDLHARISDAEKELDILQREGVKSQLQYYPDPQKALSEQNSRKEINDTYAKIQAKKDEIANLTKSLSDMEDELRKAGGDPGWANE